MAGSITCPHCGNPSRNPNGAGGRCDRCGGPFASRPPAAAPAGPAAPKARATVSAAHRKLCSTCGTDVTFGRRVRGPGGGFQCDSCAGAGGAAAPAAGPGAAPGHAASPPLLSPAGISPDGPGEEFSTLLRELGDGPPAAAAPPPPPARAATRRGGRPALIAVAAGAVILLLGITVYAFTRPSWEDQNRAAILAMKSDADGYTSHGQPREAYFQYKGLLDFVGGHEIRGQFLRGEVDEARLLMEQNYARAKPIIDAEIAREQARQAELRQQEEQRQLAAAAERERQEADRRRAEAARLAKARQEADEAAARVRRAAELARQLADQGRRRATFRASPERAALRRQADGIVSSLALTLASEDSAYRSISERSDAARRLLGIYVRMQGALNGTDVAADVDRVAARASSSALGEESAIRGASGADQAFFDLLGVWCRVLEAGSPGLSRGFFSESSSVRLRLAGDDSAVREISSYTRASMNVLESIVAARGHESQARSIVASAQSLDIGDDSAWRNAMHHCEANMNLLLELLAEDHADQARRIRSGVTVVNSGDDSALRSQSQFIQGMVETLQQLIGNE